MDLIHVDVTDGVATITLDDPTRRNAVTLEMCDQLDRALTDIEANTSVNSLVITGAPPAFCAGADLTHLGDSAEEGLLAIYEGFLRVGRSPAPVDRCGQRCGGGSGHEPGPDLRRPPGRALGPLR